jgi:hypothetical protein
MKRTITLTPEQAEAFTRPIVGSGGFQSLLRSLHKDYDGHSRRLTISTEQIERIKRYTSDYGWGGFEARLAGLRENMARWDK